VKRKIKVILIFFILITLGKNEIKEENEKKKRFKDNNESLQTNQEKIKIILPKETKAANKNKKTSNKKKL